MTTKIISGVYGATYNLTSPVTTLSIAAGGYLAGGLASAGANGYTVINAGEIRGEYYGVTLAGHGVVTNSATLISTSTTQGAGLVLGDGGAFTNAAGALTGGYAGVEVEVAAGAVNNQGAIQGQKFGVVLADGGSVTNGATTNAAATIRGVNGIAALANVTVRNYGSVLGLGTTGVAILLEGGGALTNGSATDTAALISGYVAGAGIVGGAASVNNFGTIRGAGAASAGVVAYDGGVITNGSAADPTATIEAGQFGAAFTLAPGTVANYGTIRGDGTGASGGVVLLVGGQVTNGSATDATALIEGSALGVGVSDAAGVLSNFGTVTGGYTSGAAHAGVYFGKGGTVINGSAADTTARLSGFAGVYIAAARGSVTNFGAIGGASAQFGVVLGYGGLIVNGSATDPAALVQGYGGVAGIGPSTTVRNFGTILADGVPPGVGYAGNAVILNGGGAVTNGSSADTTALLQGAVGVLGQTIAATVTNFGHIEATLTGVHAAMGGRVINGSSADTGATVSGAQAAVEIDGAAGTLTNFGTLTGGVVGGAGVTMADGGSVTNGSTSDKTALISGYAGVSMAAGGTVTNDGVIAGSAAPASVGIVMGGSGRVTNNAGALITGGSGVVLGGVTTLTNFGAIQGTGGVAVTLNGSATRLNAEAGSVFLGAIVAGNALVDIVGGVATTTAIQVAGKVEGAGTLNIDGGTSYFDSGASLNVKKIEVTGSFTTINVETTLTDSEVWDQTAGILYLVLTNQMTFKGSGSTFSGTVSGPGGLVLSGGSDTLSNATLIAGKMTISKAAVTFANQVTINGVLTATSANMTIAAGGAVLNGGGELLLTNSATNEVRGANASADLVNVSDTIRGAGDLGGGSMSLDNDTGGLIESGYSTALTIDTGSNSIVNAGVIEALGGGGVIIKSAVANAGTLASSNGTLTVDGAVTGTGIVHVFGGVADFTSSFNEHVSFGSTGRLVLAHSTSFTSTVSSFSKTGTTSFDLEDINEARATASYSGTTASGVLTVTDGTHTAKIHLTGDYTSSTWTLSADSGTGTILVDPTAPAPHAAPLAQAMAGFGGSSGASDAPAVGPEPPPNLFAAAHH